MRHYYSTPSAIRKLERAAAELEGTPFGRLNCVSLAQELLARSSDWRRVPLPEVPLDWGEHNECSRVVEHFEGHPVFAARFLPIDLLDVASEERARVIQPGDVVCIRKGKCINHVGVALSNGDFIHNLNTTHGAHVTPLRSNVYLPRLERVYRLLWVSG